jgi:hypothetical protein
MDGRYLGGPIPSNMYMWFSVKPGSHTFIGCRDPNGSNCTSPKHVEVNKDVEITLP